MTLVAANPAAPPANVIPSSADGLQILLDAYLIDKAVHEIGYELNKLYNAQAKEPDETKRKQIIIDAQNLIIKEHGPQLTLTGAYAYTAHWNYVHYPYEIDQEPTQSSDPFGVDTWTEKA